MDFAFRRWISIFWQLNFVDFVDFVDFMDFNFWTDQDLSGRLHIQF